jgi:hypothetical protein
MRTGVIIAILLLSCTILRAQEQEADIAKLLQTRNNGLAHALFQNKSFTQGSAFNGTGNASVKQFYFTDRFRPKAFSTQSFLGMKGPWAGDFKFKTDAANVNSRSTIVNATKTYGTKTSETKTASESNKESATHAYASAGAWRGRGRSQNRFDKEGQKALQGSTPLGMQGDMHPLTIAEVRDLLNKNK